MRRTRVDVLVFAATIACRATSDPVVPPDYVDPPLPPAQRQRLLALNAQAQGAPFDFAAQKAMGLHAMWLTLSGHLSLLDTTEHYLERAFLLNPDDELLDRSLGRFYNLRAVAGDDSKGGWQIRVYTAMLGSREPLAMQPRDFVAWSFSRMGLALDLRHRGRLLAALRVVRDLERTLDDWVARHPDDIEAMALAGNFALFFAGNLPFHKKRRVRRAVTLFDIVHERWDEMPSHAKDPYHCPNTYENFTFELAEAHLALREVDAASDLYRELVMRKTTDAGDDGSAGPGGNRPRTLIGLVSEERLAHLSRYAGDLRLMPPWPSDVGNCIVCHARSADIPLDSLRRIPTSRISVPWAD